MCVAFFELVEMWQLGIILWSLKTAGGANEADVLPAGHLGVYNKRTDFLICCGFSFLRSFGTEQNKMHKSSCGVFVRFV